MTREQFVGTPDNWGSHRNLLWQALEAVKDTWLPILELGCGDNSTPFLQQYCADNDLKLLSFDYNYKWAKMFGAIHVRDWDKDVDWKKEYGVVLIDESPGEHRKVSLMHSKAQIKIIHDSEPIGWNASDYQVRPLFGMFKFVKDQIPEKPDAWTSAVSNTIDVTQFT